MEVLLELSNRKFDVAFDAQVIADFLKMKGLKVYLYEHKTDPQPLNNATGEAMPFLRNQNASIKIQFIGGEPEILNGLNYFFSKFRQSLDFNYQILRIGEIQ